MTELHQSLQSNNFLRRNSGHDTSLKNSEPDSIALNSKKSKSKRKIQMFKFANDDNLNQKDYLKFSILGNTPDSHLFILKTLRLLKHYCELLTRWNL